MTIEVPVKRSYGRSVEEIRPVSIAPNALPQAEGSAYIKVGDTHVICTATVEERVPGWMKGTGRGWVTAEYAMLPRATSERTRRESREGKQGGRTVEIQRLIGRAIRAGVDLEKLGERQIILDCDVIRADGGTRCASITGAWVALALACRRLLDERRLRAYPITSQIAALSVGVVNGVPMVDLDYREDSRADVDVNVVMTDKAEYVEIQGTAEASPFSFGTLEEMMVLASTGIDALFAKQRAAIGE
ncbi:MAG TPA: ribonuclease PH [Thermomicrobiales bacterium]|nr:ribonuclease PH [Thermomicrobiales bacterium]